MKSQGIANFVLLHAQKSFLDVGHSRRQTAWIALEIPHLELESGIDFGEVVEESQHRQTRQRRRMKRVLARRNRKPAAGNRVLQNGFETGGDIGAMVLQAVEPVIRLPLSPSRQHRGRFRAAVHGIVAAETISVAPKKYRATDTSS